MSKFSTEDQIIVRSLLKKLPPRQRKVIILRFWHNHSVSEIARKMKITWEETEKLLNDGLSKLKEDCMDQPRFSRALSLIA